MKVLLTRTIANNEKLKRSLETKGYECFQEPLIDYNLDLKLLISILPQLRAKEIIITSNYLARVLALVASNPPDVMLNLFQHPHNIKKILWQAQDDSSRALDNKTLQKTKLKFHVVGKESSAVLKKEGHEILTFADNIDDLLEQIRPASSMIYLRGSNITQQIPNVTEYIIYQNTYKKNFCPETIKLFQNNEIDIITLFSQESAKAFLECLKNADLLNALPKIKLYCFSQKIAAVFENYPWKTIYADSPNIDSFKLLF